MRKSYFLRHGQVFCRSKQNPFLIEKVLSQIGDQEADTAYYLFFKRHQQWKAVILSAVLPPSCTHALNHATGCSTYLWQHQVFSCLTDTRLDCGLSQVRNAGGCKGAEAVNVAVGGACSTLRMCPGGVCPGVIRNKRNRSDPTFSWEPIPLPWPKEEPPSRAQPRSTKPQKTCPPWALDQLCVVSRWVLGCSVLQ